MTDIVEELTRSGGPTAKWNEIGDVRRIVISSVEKRQETDFSTGKPVTWDDGEPKWQFVFSGTDPDTGEETRFFCKSLQLTAVKEALRAAGVGAGDTLTGGTLAIKWTGEEPSKTKGFANKKTWSAQYKAPTIAAGDLF